MTNEEVVYLIKEEGLAYAVTAYHQPDDYATRELWDAASDAVLNFLSYLQDQTGEKFDF